MMDDHNHGDGIAGANTSVTADDGMGSTARGGGNGSTTSDGTGKAAMPGTNHDGGTVTVRGDDGRFVAGCRPGPGRPAVNADAATTDTRAIRRAIVASWDRVNGPAILDRLANENPLAYLRLVVAMLPRNIDARPSADGEAIHHGRATVHEIGEIVRQQVGNWREQLKYAMLPLDNETDRPVATNADLR